MQLYLSGGGDQNQTQKLDDTFFENLREIGISKLVYIPLATKSEKISKSIDWFKGAYGNRVEEIIVWDSSENINLEDLTKNVAVYIGGGNTFLLMSLLKSFNLEQRLRDFIENDGVVYGGSAGAVILGKEISVAGFLGDSNDINLKELAGLNLIDNYSIWPHYDKNDDSSINDYIKQTGNNVIAIPEDGGVYKSDTELKSIGSGDVYIFDPIKRKS